MPTTEEIYESITQAMEACDENNAKQKEAIRHQIRECYRTINSDLSDIKEAEDRLLATLIIYAVFAGIVTCLAFFPIVLPMIVIATITITLCIMTIASAFNFLFQHVLFRHCHGVSPEAAQITSGALIEQFTNKFALNDQLAPRVTSTFKIPNQCYVENHKVPLDSSFPPLHYGPTVNAWSKDARAYPATLVVSPFWRTVNSNSANTPSAPEEEHYEQFYPL